jgi:hypothetical protein
MSTPVSNEERFERATEKVLADRSPRREVETLSPEEQRMVRMAQLLRGSRIQEMAPDFTRRLHARLFPRRLVARRTAFLSGLGVLAAGMTAGIGVDRAVRIAPSTLQEPLVGANGCSYPIATLADLPDRTIQPFTAGAVQGFLIQRKWQL